jgi:broad specificity phosphatase PhoE
VTTFFLVRHAAHDNVGSFLAGREVDVPLGAAGREQAERLALRMSRERADMIHTSPRRRTRETAAAVAAAMGLRETVAENLDEIDFGKEWCGRSFDDLNCEPLWRTWNKERAMARTPAGESLADVQRRVVGHMERVRGDAPEKSAVLVSHADPIKLALAHYLELRVESIDRFDIAPASISAIVVGDWGAKLLGLNETPG